MRTSRGGKVYPIHLPHQSMSETGDADDKDENTESDTPITSISLR